MTKLITRASLCLAIIVAPAFAARANVYATDPHFNGSPTSFATAQGDRTAIGYVLNEPATLGVTVQIWSSNTLIRTITNGGTAFGTNVAYWDGFDVNSNIVPLGAYTATITAASSGHTNWTQISSDTQPGMYVWDPQGIAVDNNSNSIAYGRVFIGNAANGPHSTRPPIVDGDINSILMCNADGTYSDAGAYGTGGYSIIDDSSSDVPQKMRMGDDDRLYMNDLYLGQVVSFDPALLGYQVVLTPNNYANNPYTFESQNNPQTGQYGWFSMDVIGAGTTNGLIWLGDADTPGVGVWYWHLTNGMADPNDTTGTQAIQTGGSLSVTASGGLMVDTNLDIFVSQDLTDPGDTNAICMDFTNATPSTPWTTPATTGTAWTAGGSDDSFLDVYDTTIDSRQNPKYVACALSGPTAQGIRILNATNGAILTTLDTNNQYNVTAWDAVGNLYAASESLNRWRVFAPPDGPNQSTTPVQQVINIVKTPTILGISAAGSNTVILFTGSSSNLTSSYTILSSQVVQGPYTTNTSVTIATNSNPGFYDAIIPQNGPTGFYQLIH